MNSIVEIPITMSSCEIAELTGKRHDNVMADKCQAHISYSPHTNMVFVSAYPTGTDFFATPQPAPLFRNDVLLIPILNRPLDEAFVADRVRKLDGLMARLHGLLMEEAAHGLPEPPELRWPGTRPATRSASPP